MLVDKHDGGQIHIPEEYMQIGLWAQRNDARFWSRVGAIAVIAACVWYWFVSS